MIFLDTSALYALADRADLHHVTARRLFGALTSANETLFTHNYILVECAALMQRRLGLAVAIAFLNDMKGFLVVWVDQTLHAKALTDFARSTKRKISFVDCVSFTLMRERDSHTTFAFDGDFVKAGFALYDARRK